MTSFEMLKDQGKKVKYEIAFPDLFYAATFVKDIGEYAKYNNIPLTLDTLVRMAQTSKGKIEWLEKFGWEEFPTIELVKDENSDKYFVALPTAVTLPKEKSEEDN